VLWPASVMRADRLSNSAIILEGRDRRSRLQCKTSSANIFDLDPIRRGVTQADLTGITDIGSQWADRRETAPRAPLFEILQRNGIQSDRVLACIQCGMVNRVVRLRLRAASILRDEAIH